MLALTCILIGFGVPLLIAIIAYQLNDKNSSRGIQIITREQENLDLSKLKFIQETEFWNNYNKE